MGLLSKEKAEITEKYFKVWEVIEILRDNNTNSWEEVGEFLGHHDFDTNLNLFKIDPYYRIHDINTNEVIRDLITSIGLLWLTGDEELKEIKRKVYSYYWLKDDIYNFQPLINLNLEKLKELSLNTPSINLKAINPNIDNYKFYLFKQPVLSTTESACIMSEQNPLEINNPSKFNHANTFILSAIASGDLKTINHHIDTNELRAYLFDLNIIISGFNENPDHNTQNEKKILKEKLQELEKTIKERDQLIEELKQNKLYGSDLLDLIFDESATERYAPDLALSIRLWEHIYIINPNTDSHSNNANSWLKSNTGYDVTKKQGSASKIREIANPFLKWGTQRDKKYRK